MEHPNIQLFIKYVKKIAKKHKIKIRFPNQSSIKFSDGIYVSGYFDEGKKILAVGKKNPQYLPTLIHEFSHCEQYIEDDPAWCSEVYLPHNEQYWEDANEALDLWIEYKIELSELDLKICIKSIRDCELDCEKRTVQNIIKFDLPIDIGEYIQRANSYLYLYTAVQKSRIWPAKDHSPYFFKQITDQMPGHFCNDYENLSPKIAKLYMDYCFCPKGE